MRCPLLRIFAIALLVLTSACAFNHDSANAVMSGPAYIRLAPSAPPHNPVEMRPAATSPQQQVWRAGYWDYDGSSFSWVPGSYMARPTPNAAWMPDRWEKRKFGWAFIPGYWH